MTANRGALLLPALIGAGLCMTCPCPADAAQAQPPIIQPGAPGQPARDLTAEEAIRIAVTSYSPDDVRFMQDMIPHHHQALEMAVLAPARTNRPDLLEAAKRIESSQADEIRFMQQWLRERGQSVPDPAAHGAMHADHKMAGMATPEHYRGTGRDQGLFVWRGVVAGRRIAVSQRDPRRDPRAAKPASPGLTPVLAEHPGNLVDLTATCAARRAVDDAAVITDDGGQSARPGR